MSKFYDKIGFVLTHEVSPGVWKPSYDEIFYSGDVVQTNYRWDDQSKINPDLEINHTISILCDNFVMQNMFALQYVCYMGRRWRVTKITVNPPRMLLTLGAEYIKEDENDRVTGDQGAARCSET